MYIHYICRYLNRICTMRKYAVNDHTEDSLLHIADIHLVTNENIKNLSLGSYHYHKHFEIIVIQQGSVKIMVNYMIKEIASPSVIMLHSNLPHMIIGHTKDIRATIIHIPDRILTGEIERIPEMHKDKTFIQNSTFGYLFQSSQLSKKIISLSYKIHKEKGFMQISHLFKLLYLLSKSNKVEYLSINSEQIINTQGKVTYETSVERTFRFIYTHFRDDCSLAEIAGYANQNASALCRSFKKASGYTITGFINRLRVEKACELLRNTNLTITDISYQSGFNTFSYFSTQFKAITGLTPSQYRDNTLLHEQ